VSITTRTWSRIMAAAAFIKLALLRSPKASIQLNQRFLNILNGMKQGDPIPPIDVQPLPDGTYRIQEGVRRAVAARELGLSEIEANVEPFEPGGGRTIPLSDVVIDAGSRVLSGLVGFIMPSFVLEQAMRDMTRCEQGPCDL